MASQEQTRSSSPTTFYHALLRPTVLQILRAQGYYSCSPAVLDTVTELAGRYMTTLAQTAAKYAEHNNEDPTDLTIVDVRMALESCGALVPTRDPVADAWRDDEDTRGVDNFVRWSTSKKNNKIRQAIETMRQNGPPENINEPLMDYLTALKKKHNKTDQDSKYAGTVLGKGLDHGEVMVEGGEATSIQEWERQMRERQQKPPEQARSPSSGLSSLTDGEVEMMDLS